MLRRSFSEAIDRLVNTVLDSTLKGSWLLAHARPRTAPFTRRDESSLLQQAFLSSGLEAPTLRDPTAENGRCWKK